jgi:NADH-quinone oxidoreductase subunit M
LGSVTCNIFMSHYAQVLPLLLTSPFAASLLLFALARFQPSGTHAPARPFLRYAVNLLAGTAFILPALYAVLFVFLFPKSLDPATGYAWLCETPLGVPALGISLTFGLNGLSLLLFALAALVGAAAGIQALGSDVDNKPAYLALLLLMFGGILAMFASVDVFFLYFFHEVALIPTFLLILFWGGQGRRTAAIQMAVYLTLGAMAALAGLILIFLQAGGESMSLLHIKAAFAANPPGASSANWIFGLLLFGFGTLVSLFPFHSWAPATYTEAPTPVAMLHAGVLKKFGLYGLIQFGALLVPGGLAHWAPVLFWLALGNVLIVGVMALGQRHLKELISYSSIAHMGTCFLGIYAFSLGGDRAGLGAAVLLMFGHGLAVAALFLLSHGVWQRTGTLELGACGGLAKRAPVFAAFFIAAAMASIGLPGFANFWGELGVYASLGQLAPWKLVLAISGIVISAIYMLRAVAAVFFGPEPPELAARAEEHPVRDISWNERIAAGLLLAALLAVGFWPRWFGDALDAALKP